ncbi:hypothetical protein QE152_g29899 [Popillia japonica]|uniref:Uncharacterized protein n=1 Tax=Popillia japonica TaxID=7064 RepID=A0AAW1JFL8_POPJA
MFLLQLNELAARATITAGSSEDLPSPSPTDTSGDGSVDGAGNFETNMEFIKMNYGGDGGGSDDDDYSSDWEEYNYCPPLPPRPNNQNNDPRPSTSRPGQFVEDGRRRGGGQATTHQDHLRKKIKIPKNEGKLS